MHAPECSGCTIQTESRRFRNDSWRPGAYSGTHRKWQPDKEFSMYADVLPVAARQLADGRPASPQPIRLIRASAGNTVRLIPVSEVICLEAADKYVTVVTATGESQVRM